MGKNSAWYKCNSARGGLPHLVELCIGKNALAALALDIEAQDPERRDGAPLADAFVVQDVVEEHVHLQGAAGLLSVLWGYGVGACNVSTNTYLSNSIEHIDRSRASIKQSSMRESNLKEAVQTRTSRQLNPVRAAYFVVDHEPQHERHVALVGLTAQHARSSDLHAVIQHALHARDERRHCHIQLQE